MENNSLFMSRRRRTDGEIRGVKIVVEPFECHDQVGDAVVISGRRDSARIQHNEAGSEVGVDPRRVGLIIRKEGGRRSHLVEEDSVGAVGRRPLRIGIDIGSDKGGCTTTVAGSDISQDLNLVTVSRARSTEARDAGLVVSIGLAIRCAWSTGRIYDNVVLQNVVTGNGRDEGGPCNTVGAGVDVERKYDPRGQESQAPNAGVEDYT